jgi:hypothetical protein
MRSWTKVVLINTKSSRCEETRIDMDVDLNGTMIHLDRPSDKAVVQRVAAQIQRRIAEDDWRPYASKADALGAWKKLGGIRLKVLKAFNLVK